MSDIRHIVLTAAGVLAAIPVIDFIRWCQAERPWIMGIGFAVALLVVATGIKVAESRP